MTVCARTRFQRFISVRFAITVLALCIAVLPTKSWADGGKSASDSGGGTQSVSLPKQAFQQLTSADQLSHIGQQYLICYEPQNGELTSVSSYKTEFGTTLSCHDAKPQFDAAAAKAGARIVLVVRSTSECSQITLSLNVNAQSINAVTTNPFRGLNALEFSISGNLATVPAAGQQPYDCYLVYPNPLGPDSSVYITLNVNSNSYEAEIPQVHTYYHFGAATGVAVSSIFSPTYAYSSSSTSTSFEAVQTSHPRLVEPVFFVTWYPHAIDPEAPARWTDFGVVAGLSEKSPTSSFYVGLSVEPIRDFEVIVGANASEVTTLATNAYSAGPGSSGASPPIVNRYKYGGFIAVAITLNNLLNKVFGGGGGS